MSRTSPHDTAHEMRGWMDVESDVIEAKHLARILDAAMIRNVEYGAEHKDVAAASHVALMLLKLTERISADFHAVHHFGGFSYAAERARARE